MTAASTCGMSNAVTCHEPTSSVVPQVPSRKNVWRLAQPCHPLRPSLTHRTVWKFDSGKICPKPRRKKQGDDRKGDSRPCIKYLEYFAIVTIILCIYKTNVASQVILNQFPSDLCLIQVQYMAILIRRKPGFSMLVFSYDCSTETAWTCNYVENEGDGDDDDDDDDDAKSVAPAA